MDIITVKTSALNYIDNVMVAPGQYENGNLYIALYDTVEQELYTDLSTNINIPVFPGTFYTEKGSEQEKFCNEQKSLFQCLDREVKQGFNKYILYRFIDWRK